LAATPSVCLVVRCRITSFSFRYPSLLHMQGIRSRARTPLSAIAQTYRMSSSSASTVISELRTLYKPLPNPDAWYIVATATALATAQAHHFLPEIYKQATADLGSAPESKTSSPKNFEDDPLPRRQVVRRLKETITKSAILVGVGKSIEAAFVLNSVTEEGDRDDAQPRSDFTLDEKNHQRGKEGLLRVYQQNLGPIDEKFGDAHEMLRIGYDITYGYFLSLCRPWHPEAPLTFSETELIVISCFIAQQSPRELKWHLRGCLRAGWTEEQVELFQQGIEKVAIACGVEERLLKDLPRVKDVEEVDDLSS